tara:strand:+ start:185 stop:769 length:585 start_codon:yes stop_codon:yes gene_type:complete
MSEAFTKMSEDTSIDAEKSELMSYINDAIAKIVADKELSKVGSISRSNPEKVAKILYLSALGMSQTSIVRKCNYNRNTVINVLVDYADYKNQFRELGGKLSAKSYMNLESLEEDMIQVVRERMQTGEYEPSAKDIKDISIAKINSSRQALTARGEVSAITESRNAVTQEDYEDTLKAARERIEQLKKVEEVIDE